MPTPTLASVKLRNQLLAIDPTLTVELRNVRVNGVLFGCTGFVTGRNGAVVYVSTDHNHGLNTNRPLYRTARDNRDYTGGPNKFSTNDNLAADVVALIAALDSLSTGAGAPRLNAYQSDPLGAVERGEFY